MHLKMLLWICFTWCRIHFNSHLMFGLMFWRFNLCFDYLTYTLTWISTLLLAWVLQSSFDVFACTLWSWLVLGCLGSQSNNSTHFGCCTLYFDISIYTKVAIWFVFWYFFTHFLSILSLFWPFNQQFVIWIYISTSKGKIQFYPNFLMHPRTSIREYCPPPQHTLLLLLLLCYHQFATWRNCYSYLNLFSMGQRPLLGNLASL